MHPALPACKRIRRKGWGSNWLTTASSFIITFINCYITPQRPAEPGISCSMAYPTWPDIRSTYIKTDLYHFQWLAGEKTTATPGPAPASDTGIMIITNRVTPMAGYDSSDSASESIKTAQTNRRKLHPPFVHLRKSFLVAKVSIGERPSRCCGDIDPSRAVQPRDYCWSNAGFKS